MGRDGASAKVGDAPSSRLLIGLHRRIFGSPGVGCVAVCMGYRPKYEYRRGGLNPEAAQYWLELFMRTREVVVRIEEAHNGCTDNELYGYGSLMDSKVSRWHLHASAYVNSNSKDVARESTANSLFGFPRSTAHLVNITTKCRFMGHHSTLYVHAVVVRRPKSNPHSTP